MTQCSGFVVDDGKVMPGITNQLAAAKAARMLRHDVIVGRDAYAVGGETDRDHLIGPGGGYAVTITVSRHQTLGTDTTHVIDMTIEAGGDRNQGALLFSKALRNGA